MCTGHTPPESTLRGDPHQSAPHQPMSKDSRRAPRAKILSLTVRYKSATVAEFVENHSYDVSRGGIFIKTASPFPTGTLIKFEVRIAEEQSVMTGVGRVTWRRERDRGPDEPAGMGVKFIKIDDDSVAVIDRLVAARSHAPSNFEDGAAKQGIRLSDPPAPGPSDRSSSRPPPSSDMLDQSSELLKSAVGSLRPGQLSADSKPELPSGDDVDDSQLFKSLGVQKRDPGAKDETSDDEEATVPKSGASLHDQSSNDDSDAEAEEEFDDSDADDDDGDADEDVDDAGSEEAATRSDSGRPSTKRGKSKKKKSRKKKKKFKYANIPSARTDSDSPRSARQVVGRKSSGEPAMSTLTTTPPTRREGGGASKQESKSSSFGLIAIALIAMIGVGYWLLRDSGKPSSQTSAEPPKAAAAPSATAPSATAQDTSEPSTTAEPSAAEPSATATDAGQDAGGGAAISDGTELEATAAKATEKPAPPKRPAKRPAPPRKPRPKSPPKPKPSPAPEATTSTPALPAPPTSSGVSTQGAPTASAPKSASPEPTPKAEPPATPKPTSPPASTAVTPPPSPAPSSSSPSQ